MQTNIQNLINHIPVWMENTPPYLRISVNYSSIGLWYTIFMTIIINIILLTVILNLKVEYSRQRYSFYFLLLLINIFYFIQFYTTFVVLFILFCWLIIISAQSFLKNVYIDYMLQRVQNIKFKNITKNKWMDKKKVSIKEAFETDIILGIKLLIQNIDENIWNLWLFYLWSLFFIFINIVLSITYIYITYGSSYFIK